MAPRKSKAKKSKSKAKKSAAKKSAARKSSKSKARRTHLKDLKYGGRKFKCDGVRVKKKKGSTVKIPRVFCKRDMKAEKK